MGCVWERVWRLKTTLKIKGVFASSSREDFPQSEAMCSAHDRNAKSHDSWFSWVFRGSGLPVRYSWNILFCYFGISAALYLHSHYIYHHYSHIERSSFQKENPSHNPWELEIVIPTILYIIHCDFSQLLPLHIQILERLIAQTLTTLILSVKWGFGSAKKHWKKPFFWWMQSDWIAWSWELEKIRLRQVSW